MDQFKSWLERENSLVKPTLLKAGGIHAYFMKHFKDFLFALFLHNRLLCTPSRYIEHKEHKYSAINHNQSWYKNFSLKAKLGVGDSCKES